MANYVSRSKEINSFEHYYHVRIKNNGLSFINKNMKMANAAKSATGVVKCSFSIVKFNQPNDILTSLRKKVLQS